MEAIAVAKRMRCLANCTFGQSILAPDVAHHPRTNFTRYDIHGQTVGGVLQPIQKVYISVADGEMLKCKHFGYLWVQGQVPARGSSAASPLVEGLTKGKANSPLRAVQCKTPWGSGEMGVSSAAVNPTAS